MIKGAAGKIFLLPLWIPPYRLSHSEIEHSLTHAANLSGFFVSESVYCILIFSFSPAIISLNTRGG
jgi:hypothetical protein